MEIDKVFSNDVDGVADNLFSAVKNSVSEIKAMQQRKAAENVQLVIQALKKIESDLQDKFDGVTTVIEKRVSTIKDGRDGLDGRNGRDGKDGRPGRDGAPGARGPAGVPGTNGRDGEDGVSVTDARIDFDGSLIISLSSGREINVGEVVAPDLAEKIKVITNGGGTSQSVLDSLASLQAQITALQNLGAVNYVGTWNASTNSPTITSGSGDKGDYYVVSVAGSTNIDGQTLWGVGDWIIFNGAVWQKVDGGSTGDFTNLSASGTVTFTGLNASQAVFTNGSDQLVSNAITGTGNVVMSASPTLTGTASLAALTTSSTVTHNGGTANGVAYLNGSKVLTTGSALTYNGSTLQNTTSAGGISAVFTDATYSTLKISHADTTGNIALLNGANQNYAVFGSASIFYASSTEGMRLTSTGLGIGTSSPDSKLVVQGGSGTYAQIKDGTVNTFIQARSADSVGVVGTLTNHSLAFWTNSASRMTLDTSGNLGLGVTPSAWSTFKAFEFGTANGHSLFGSGGVGGETHLGTNVYYNAGYKYANNDFATDYKQTNGVHSWHTAASGTAGNAITFTQAMTLDDVGRLNIGGTASPSAYRLAITGDSASYMGGIIFRQSSTDTLYLGNIAANNTTDFEMWNPRNGYIRFATNNTERCRITSGGYFKASYNGSYVGSTASYHELVGGANDWTLYVRNTTGSSPSGVAVNYSGVAPNGTGNVFLLCSDSSTTRAEIRSNGGLANYSANNVNLSDRREKTNFAPAKSYLDTICAIPVQTFNYIDQSDDDPGLTLGVVAQDVQAVAPELVMESNWGTEDNPKMRLSIYQTDLQYALMKALQELKAEFDAYKATHP